MAAESTAPPLTYEEEADHIHDALFGGAAPEVIRRRYAAVAGRLDERAGPAETLLTRRVLAGGHDLEALEVAGRYRNRLSLLSLKFRVLLYLVETRPEYQDVFIKSRGGRWGVFWALKMGAWRTAWKLGKGLLLMGRVTRG